MTARGSGCVRNAFPRAGSTGGPKSSPLPAGAWKPMSFRCFYGMVIRFIQGPLLRGADCQHNFFYRVQFLSCVPPGVVAYIAAMDNDIVLTYRGRSATRGDIEFINRLIDDNPTKSRRALSQLLCKEWKWVQANGSLRDMIARGFMLELHRNGYIILPAKKQNPANPFVNRKKPEQPVIDQTRLTSDLKGIQPLEIVLVKNTPHEPLFNSLIEHHHYLGYCHPVGEQLKYMVFAGDRPVACFSWSSAPRHIGARDRFIGWKKEHRDHNLHYIAYNSRFLILPWFQVPHLASFLLGYMFRNLSRDWKRVYSHPIYYLETFVDTELFTGTCYKAANWQYLGDTTGRGKQDNSHIKNRSIKAVWGYPLTRDFRQQMTFL